MPTKKKSTTKKKCAKKPGTSLAAYTRKVYGSVAVKSKTKKIVELEKKLKAAKKEKLTAVKKIKAQLKKKK